MTAESTQEVVQSQKVTILSHIKVPDFLFEKLFNTPDIFHHIKNHTRTQHRCMEMFI